MSRSRSILGTAGRAAALGAILAAVAAHAGPSLNGFDLESERVPAEAIVHGGPPRDGIPALERPATVPIVKAPWPDDAMVLGVRVGGEARAYPVDVLDWHELVNDELGGQPILVSWCPLCGTGIVYDRHVDGTARRFGVSGLLWRSDLLMFDRETGSLWSQIGAEAITGPAEGTRLVMVRSRMARLGAWRAEHPDSTILTRETGHRRAYGRSPYGDYAISTDLYFPVPEDDRYHPKMPTLGLRLAVGPARAYPAVEIARAGGRVRERFAGRAVEIAYDPDEQVFEVSAPEDVEVIEGFWFAWMAFHPDSLVYMAP